MELLVKQPQEIAPASSQRVDELVDSFIQSLDVKQSSKLLYRRTMKQYFSWISEKSYLLSEIARPQILEYKEALLSSGKSSLTVGSYLISVRGFYEWTEANKYYPNVAKGIKTPKRKRQFRKQPLLPAQATALLSYYQSKALRDYAIISLLLRTGLRTIEVIRANVEDITYKGTQRVLLVHGKGREEKDQFVVLTDKTYKPIADYLASRAKLAPKEPLFTSTSNNSQGDRLTTRTISFIAKEGLKAIGLDEKAFTAHSLRHTAIVSARRAGATPEQAQALGRHSSPVTTQIYDEIFREEERIKNSAEALIDSLF
jgi:integrase/recombinase XerD